MKILIRIKGQVKIRKDMKETLERLNLRNKYNAIILPEKPEYLGMLKDVENFVAFGDIDAKTLKILVEKRAEALPGKKVDVDKVIKGLEAGKTLRELELKPFFRLPPPIKGIKTKEHFPRGVLGNHREKINDLLMRMLQ